MSSDITNAVVVAIQGNAVKAETEGSAQDGYVLTWKNSDNQWEAKPSVGLQSQTFTSSGTWTCPANVFNVWLTGWGGGAGGGGGCGNSANALGGAGGGAAVRVSSVVPVVPGTSYAVNIGNGGLGGSGFKAAGPVNNGAAGTAPETTFGNLFTALGGSGGQADNHASNGWTIGGLNNLGNGSSANSENDDQLSPNGIGCGGTGSSINQYPNAGYPQESHGGGAGGSHGASGGGGGGGGAGSGGSGGAAGSGGASPTNGANASTNSGAGGGGGGGSTSNVNGGDGGNGGSGQLTVSWIG